MKTLKFKPPEWLKSSFRWGEDVDRIVSICKAKGYNISEADAHHAWEEHSDSMAASWLMLDEDDDDVFQSVMDSCEVIDNGN
jgi:hypothetical protein